MPASYVHQCVADAACDDLSLYTEPALRSAVRAGSEGPDPFFYSLLSLPGKTVAPKLGSVLHTQKTDDFMLALCDACAGSALTRAYACGFITHYATDTTFHPFVYAHSLTDDGAYSSTLHCTLEHQFETMLYRRQGHAAGLPVQMAGIAALRSEERTQIAAALAQAVNRIFPELSVSTARVRRSFDDAVSLCALLRSESGKKFNAMGTLLHPVHLDRALHAHMMPTQPPATDIANDAHERWSSIWTPDAARFDSFDDLFAAARERAAELVQAADGYMAGRVSYASLRAMHGGASYDSGMSWQTSCAPSQAPGVRKKAGRARSHFRTA